MEDKIKHTLLFGCEEHFEGLGKNSVIVTYMAVEGFRVNFWRHMWCGDNALRFTMPNNYSISSKKETTIQQVQKLHERESHWTKGPKV